MGQVSIPHIPCFDHGTHGFIGGHGGHGSRPQTAQEWLDDEHAKQEYMVISFWGCREQDARVLIYASKASVGAFGQRFTPNLKLLSR